MLGLAQNCGLPYQIVYEIAWAVWEASRIWLKSTEVCSNPPRRSRGGFEQTEVDFSFQIPEGCPNPPRRSRGGFGQPEANLNKHLARSQGSEARLNSPRRSRGEFNLAEDPWDRDKCFQMLRGLSNCECYFVLIPRQGDLFPVREWEWVFTVSTCGQSWRRRTSSETGQCHTKLSGFEKYIENGFGKHTVSNRPRWVWLKPYSFL